MVSESVALWWLPLAAFLAAATWLLGLRGDLWVADHVYALQGGHWLPRSSWLAETVLHVGGRKASAAAWAGVVLAWLTTWARRPWRAWRWPLGYLALSVAVSTGLVSLLKSCSSVDCPWDLVRYGGTRAYHGLLDGGVGPSAHCFPAGHASAGYAWLALFFFFAATRPAWRRRGLAVGAMLGLLFGVDQQLRGAHFLSHDLSTAMVCWTVALGLRLVILRPRIDGRVA